MIAGYAALLAALLVGSAVAFPTYQLTIPNGVAFNSGGGKATALGHIGTTLPTKTYNQFGADYDSFSGNWQGGLCQADSDGDTFTNGEELGDPNCTWSTGEPAPLPFISDPTNAASVPSNGVVTVGIPPYIIAHGLMMIVAWIGLVPFGIMQATLYKMSTSSTHDWFKYHKIANVAAVVLTLVAFFIQYGLGGGLAGITATPHALMGICVVAFSCLQVITGFVRPHNQRVGGKKTTPRLLWEMLHQWSGRCIYLVALAAVYTGMTLGFGEIGRNLGIVMLVLASIGIFGAVLFVIVARDGGVRLYCFQQGASDSAKKGSA